MGDALEAAFGLPPVRAVDDRQSELRQFLLASALELDLVCMVQH